MKRSTLLTILIAILLAAGLHAQTTTYTGTIKDPSNTVVTSGKIVFTLKPGIDTTVADNARFVPQAINCKITAESRKEKNGMPSIVKFIRKSGKPSLMNSATPHLKVTEQSPEGLLAVKRAMDRVHQDQARRNPKLQ